MNRTLTAAAVTVTAALAVAGCNTATAHKPAAVTAAPATSSAPADTPTPVATPTPTPEPVTKVTFVITGYAPGDGYGNGPTISYGSDSDTREAGPGSINGKVTYTMPYDPAAQFYSVDAQLAGTGHLACKIVVTGPFPDAPTTVSHGSTAGGYGICSAQAAPNTPDGLSWDDEQ